MNSEKGFSTIELILAIAIAGIIMGAVGTFMTFNLRSFNITTDIIDVQYEAQLAMNQLVDIMKASEGIEEVYDDSSPRDSLLSRSDEIIPYRIVFIHHEPEVNNVANIIETIYTLDYDGNNITVDLSGDVTDSYVLAQNVSEFTIESFSITSNYEMTDAIKVSLTVSDGDSYQELDSYVKFRNKHD